VCAGTQKAIFHADKIFINATGKVGCWFAKTGTTFHGMNSYAIMRPNLQNSFGFLRFKNRLLAQPFAATTNQAHIHSIKLSIILSGVMCSSYLNRNTTQQVIVESGATSLNAPYTTYSWYDGGTLCL